MNEVIERKARNGRLYLITYRPVIPIEVRKGRRREESQE